MEIMEIVEIALVVGDKREKWYMNIVPMGIAFHQGLVTELIFYPAQRLRRD